MAKSSASKTIDFAEIQQRAGKIALLLMDVDGVLTDGKLYYLQAEDGKMFETKGFNSHDGLGLHFCHQIGLQTGVISGRNSPAVIERARMLNMTYVYQGLMSKTGAYEEILKDACITDEQVAFIGDDFTDVALMCRSGLGIAVANARPEVKEVAHFVTEASGGQGAVREAIELILKSKGLWESLIANFFNQF